MSLYSPAQCYQIALEKVANTVCCYYCIDELRVPHIVKNDLKKNYALYLNLADRFLLRHPTSLQCIQPAIDKLTLLWNTVPIYYAIPNIFPDDADYCRMLDLRSTVAWIHEQKAGALFNFMRSHDIFSARVYIKYYEKIEHGPGPRYFHLCQRCYLAEHPNLPAMQKVVYHWNVCGRDMLYRLFVSNNAWCECCKAVFLGSIKFKSWRGGALCMCPRRPHDALFCCLSCYRKEF